ncbi:MAG: hypothetical protein ACE5E7_13810 [Anaerolineae bacterium]
MLVLNGRVPQSRQAVLAQQFMDVITIGRRIEAEQRLITQGSQVAQGGVGNGRTFATNSRENFPT